MATSHKDSIDDAGQDEIILVRKQTKIGQVVSLVVALEERAGAMAAAEIKIGQVDDVQELHRTGLQTVPDRYIRDGDDRPDGDNVCAVAHIPVIDVAELQRDDVGLDKLRLACEEWGFFQVDSRVVA
jgi:hypothetical protein